jgi:tRNA threonylcarbamoyl adenosine modification protein YeaZ
MAETVLAFDTSAAHCAAALLLPGGRVLTRLEPMEKGQAERLMPLLEDLLREAGLGWSDLTRLAVGTGPGNFTGVRISVAAARGLALGLGIPAVGITRLEALAFGLPRPIMVVEDARRGEVYVQGFGTETSEALLMDGSDLTHVVETAHVTGSAAGPSALPSAMPLAEAMARLAAARDLPQPRPAPFYLRGADAAPPSDPPPVILP